MKIAYLIAAHTDTVQLYNMVSALQIKNVTTFFIHIDKKVDINPFKDKLSKCENVIFIKKRVKTYWGGFSQCRYQINLIEECLNYNCKFDRIFFLSGLDYPYGAISKYWIFYIRIQTRSL